MKSKALRQRAFRCLVRFLDGHYSIGKFNVRSIVIVALFLLVLVLAIWKSPSQGRHPSDKPIKNESVTLATAAAAKLKVGTYQVIEIIDLGLMSHDRNTHRYQCHILYLMAEKKDGTEHQIREFPLEPGALQPGDVFYAGTNGDINTIPRRGEHRDRIP